MSRRLSAEKKLAIALSYARGTRTKIITHEFGVSSHTITRVALRAGIPLRYRNAARNELTHELTAKAAYLFRAGRDTLAISRLLCVTEAKVANALARARDRERAA